MKKVICTILALLLMLSSCALATGTPSKTIGDLLYFHVGAHDDHHVHGEWNEMKGGRIIPVHEAILGNSSENFEAWIELGEYELEKLIASKGESSYFGEVKDDQNHLVSLKEMMGNGEVLVHEFYPILVFGFEEGCGEQELSMHFPTYYEAGTEVVVLIGYVKASVKDELTAHWLEYDVEIDNEELKVDWVSYDPEILAQHEDVIEWVEYPAEVLDNGGIRMHLTEEMVLEIQNDMVLMAVVSNK